MEKQEKEELTMAAVPKAVNYLIEEVAEMRAVLLHIESQLGLGVDKHRPIKEERAVEILGITDRALKKLVRNNEIPYYQRNKEERNEIILANYDELIFYNLQICHNNCQHTKICCSNSTIHNRRCCG